MRSFFAGAAAFAILSVGYSSCASAGGFFDNFFAPQRPQPAFASPWGWPSQPAESRMPPPRTPSAPRARQARKPAPPSFRAKRAEPRPSPPPIARYEEPATPHRYAPPPVGDGPLGPFVNDPTLRRGDILVTDVGLRVFRGRPRVSHAPGDFVDLAHSAARHDAKYRQLASIERNNARFAPTPASARPALTEVAAVNGSSAPALTIHGRASR